VNDALEQFFTLDNSFVRDLVGMYEPWTAAVAPDPVLLAVNDQLARELGVDPQALRTPSGVAILVGNTPPPGSSPVAQAYAGHQFGNYSPRLGDGRALLLGEILREGGNAIGVVSRYDLHLKGSGRTPFARGGDGKAAVGPMLREYIIAEAMHALRIPTTRSLAVTATGEHIARDTMLPGAVLARIAASHLRVGSFQYAATNDDTSLVKQLADYAIARHYPFLAISSGNTGDTYLSFLEHVVDAQASLVAKWMLVGFVHGVMNTDNMTISGETIDYGPCAFIDTYNPAALFSSIDQGGRYAYQNQPQIALWNLARLAETLLALVSDDEEESVALATGVLNSFPERYRTYWKSGMLDKLGLSSHPNVSSADIDSLISDLLVLLENHRVDFTQFFRMLSTAVDGVPSHITTLVSQHNPNGGTVFQPWLQRWQTCISASGDSPSNIVITMNNANPVYIPRNHLVEEALTAATNGDLGPFNDLVQVLTHPFDERAELQRYAEPAPEGFGSYRTFCGT
jgi:uncharacterized protein YdiU (UPF0061 family)